ncbi:MAG TPA: metallopeptidase family protein [Candidatus Saccharimonadales bacterium]|nr:metallopeptidase family protein [Candidatus Saccharimonadales bacterium]
MVSISDEDFRKLVSDGIDAIPPLYQEHLKDVAFIVEDDPSPDQVIKLRLFHGEVLFGLYEGVPLPRRQGTTKILPDKITIFKNPALAFSNSLDELREHIRHTIWHEVAHYYGLDHDRIHELERRNKN